MVTGMILLLIVPASLDIFFHLLGIVSTAILTYLMYIMVIGPTLKVLQERISHPPDVGSTYHIVMDHNQRSRVVSIGLLDSDIKTRMMGIEDDQTVLKFRKEPDIEEYDIYIVPKKNVFYRAPHASRLELMKSQESFESSELIGHPATLRVAASVRNNRPLQYVEFELSCDYFTNSMNEEKLRFTLTITKFYPGVDRNKPVKKGIYRFGKERKEDNQSEEVS